MERKLWLLLVFCGFKLFSTRSQRTFGKTCTVPITQEAGTCRPIKECPALAFKSGDGRFFSGCGFLPRKALVCCPTSVVSGVQTASLGKCTEYSNKIYGVKTVKQAECSQSPDFLGSGSAKPREFPHIALVGFQSGSVIKYECGGALISEEFVLTSARCTYSKHYGSAKHVRLGELDRTTFDNNERQEDFRVAKVFPHPEFKASSGYNDIGLLQLAKRVNFDVYVHPGCLPSESSSLEKKLIATSWNDILQKAVLETSGYNECSGFYSNISESTQICAGLRDGEMDSCQGTLGEPVQIIHSEVYCMYQIVGVTSYGYSGAPCIFTKVSAYHGWIEDTIWGRQRNL